tara:strand:+ start:2080 stop:2550 length:471 start_codon:yes stop_codon:yes gene_type:complete
MSRRSNIKKIYCKPDKKHDSYLVTLLLTRILKKGKLTIANRILDETFDIIENKTNSKPIEIFEKAIQNVIPLIEVKAKRVGGSTYQIPMEVSRYRGTKLALRWVLKASKDRAGRKISFKLANELIDASNGIGNAIRKREETHRMAEANKAFSHFRN